MLKEERFQKILEMLQQADIIKMADITATLGVTEMTVRRDLKALEEQELLTRIYGGAKKKQNILSKELSHGEKKTIHIAEKRYIAQLAASQVAENDAIYIGPGTTSELIYDFLTVAYAKIITNSLDVFLKFREDKRFELLFIGGRFRSQTDVFVGNFTNEILEKIRVKIAFVGTNGIYNNNVTTSNEEEGTCQKIILDNSSKRYILCDSSKIDKEDFYSFYKLADVTGIITDDKITEANIKRYEKIVKIIY